jgi:aryl-alcohol dehydrogenase-like predicted oxidoreductase
MTRGPVEALHRAGAGRIGLGCWRLSGPGRPDRATALRTIEAAYDAGIRLFDTADSYCLTEDEHGYGETLLADALRGRDDAYVVTKGGWARPGGAWEHRGAPERLARAVRASAERLGRPIDCYLLHEPDPAVPVADSMAVLFRAREEGVVRAVGVSNVDAAQLDRIVADGPVAAVQNRLSVTVRPAGTRRLLDRCAEYGIDFMAYSPLGPTLDEGDHHRVGDEPLAREIAARRAVSPQAVALAWLLGQGPHVVTIPGARRAASARDSAAAAALTLDAEELRALDGIAAEPPAPTTPERQGDVHVPG